MPVFQLSPDDLWFPSLEEFDGDIVACGGDLRPERFLAAYKNGIFPWYNEPGEILWWSPEYRCLLFLDDVRISHSMRNVFNKKQFHITMDTNFRGVLEGCRGGTRAGATWLLDEMVVACEKLFEMGYAHSVEVWQDGELVGGLYGASLGNIFFGESMFSKVANSSKAALIALAYHLDRWRFQVIDCQVYTEHLGSLGACTVSRKGFYRLLNEYLDEETRLGPWTNSFDESLQRMLMYYGNKR